LLSEKNIPMIEKLMNLSYKEEILNDSENPVKNKKNKLEN